MKRFEMADLFCGAGGTSEGALQALKAMGYAPRLTAVNHWDVAVATHTVNHPDARHFCASVDSLNPREMYGDTKLDLLWASPECTHHSNARGGAPVNDQSRATAWCVVRWAEALKPGVVLVENVPEFANWGPTTSGAHPRPIKSKKGQTFRAWVSAMESLGYRADHTLLCAADFGDPTTRRRLFVQFVRGRRNIVWPEPTHGKAGADLFGSRKPWRGAREIIDWSKKGTSIYGRKRPLADNTMRRILAGLKQFGMKDFVMSVTHHGADESRCMSAESPLPTVTCAHRGELALLQPYVVEWDQQASAGGVRGSDEPLSTVCTKARHGVAQPYLVEYHGDAQGAEPVPTVTTHDRYGLARPVVRLNGRRYEVDILFRMLNAQELAGAMGFPNGYRFTGNNTEIVKQIGNAVPCGLSRALAAAAVSQDAGAARKLAGVL